MDLTMTVIARLDVTPIEEDSMADAIATAVGQLDNFDVAYETTPTGTVIEAESVDEVFAAATAAHQSIDEDRVITELKVDDMREREEHSEERVAKVEKKLGRPPRGERP